MYGIFYVHNGFVERTERHIDGQTDRQKQIFNIFFLFLYTKLRPRLNEKTAIC